MKKSIKVIPILAAILLFSGCGKRNSIPSNYYSTPAPQLVSATPTPTVPPTAVPTAVATPVPTQATVLTPVPAPTAAPTVMPTYAPTPAPIQTPFPTPAPTVAPYVAITKSPTGERVEEGGRALFVAHAANQTGITWIISNAAGTAMYFNNEAANQFPGLSISGIGTDTLILDKIPYEMNGWRVQARYEGLGGPAYTEYASITVNRTVETYESLLEKYKKVVNGADATEFGFSYICSYNRNLGYMLQDVDGNGVYELIISASGDSMIFDMYTMSGNTPIKVLSSGERDRYYLTSEGQIANEASSSAFVSSTSRYYYYSGSLILRDAAGYDSTVNSENPWYIIGNDGNRVVAQEADASGYMASVQQSYVPLSLTMIG